MGLKMEYSLEFSERLIEAADALQLNSVSKEETSRTILYFSCLSCEISMKAVLESAGYSKSKLRGFSHQLDKILDEISSCSHIDPESRASSIRAKVVEKGFANGTVGALLTHELDDVSTYPNQVRYGEVVKHYPPETMLKCAKVVHGWCRENQGKLRRCP